MSRCAQIHRTCALRVRDVLCLYDVEQLVAVNTAVSIHVIKFKIPAELVLHLPSHHQAEGGHILHEIYVAVLQKQADVKHEQITCTENQQRSRCLR